MQSFGEFLIGMGYPENRIRDPGDGAYSQSPYADSERQAGAIAWYYEHEGVRPMLVGHSQGGIQVVRILAELRRHFRRNTRRVFNPLTGQFEERTTIVDPLTGRERPVVGVFGRPTRRSSAPAAGRWSSGALESAAQSSAIFPTLSTISPATASALIFSPGMRPA